MEARTVREPGEKLWEPSPEGVERAALTAYARWLERERGLDLRGYAELWRWSVSEIEAFWASIWEYFEVRASAPYSSVLAERTMPGARWFEGAQLNYAEHLFRRKDPAVLAVQHAAEGTQLGQISWGELRDRVASVAAGLRELGVARGDRVVAYVPNSPEALIAFLATASLGAIWSSCSTSACAPSSIASRRSSRRRSSALTATPTAESPSTGWTSSRGSSGSCRPSSGRS